MGIPKLFSDLQNYSKRVKLGTNELDGVVDLIIDGPCLVYFVHNRLLAYKSQRKNLLVSIPTYQELGQAVLHFLKDLESIGTRIQKVYFDGGLPVEKRVIRLARLERSREELTVLRTAFPQGFALPKSGPHTTIDYHAALWEPSTESTVLRDVPAPALMVPAVIEALKSSRFGTIVEQVPGEADQFCAIKSRVTGWHILTNDSDLPLYDCGVKTQVVWLNTIIRRPKDRIQRDYHISAQTIIPIGVAKTLQLPSLREMGFERFLDSSATSSMIKLRAADLNRRRSMVQDFDQFCEQYRYPKATPSSSLDISGLDPRLSELALQIYDAKTRTVGQDHMYKYFPATLEDPSRDASWTYGAEYRRTAYDLLAHLTDCPQTPLTVIEIYRKGAHLGKTEVLVTANHREIPPSLTKIQDWRANLPNDTKASLAWTGFALSRVLDQRSQYGKPVPSEETLMAVFGFRETFTMVSWETIHLHASILAVLYSLRMLQQIARLALNHCVKCRMTASSIIDTLKTLSSISKLFHNSMETIERVARFTMAQVKAVIDAALRSSMDVSKNNPEPLPAVQQARKKTRNRSKPTKTIGSKTADTSRPAGGKGHVAANPFDILRDAL